MPDNFESLPNEILVEIFKYTRAVDICRGFHQLNHRLDGVLRSMPLHVNISINVEQELPFILPLATQVSRREEPKIMEYVDFISLSPQNQIS